MTNKQLLNTPAFKVNMKQILNSRVTKKYYTQAQQFGRVEYLYIVGKTSPADETIYVVETVHYKNRKPYRTSYVALNRKQLDNSLRLGQIVVTGEVK